LIYKEKLEGLEAACKTASASFEHFKKMQMVVSSDSAVIRQAKGTYANDIKTLDEKLNRYLADTYGLGTKTQWKSKKEKDQAYQSWKESHQPFHWFAEFYEIISKGGFDVVIGNPPYVEYNSIKNIYTVKNIKCLSAGNLYAYVIERSFNLTRNHSRVGMIIQLSAFCTPRMASFQQQWLSHSKQSFLSFFDDRPGKLFDGLEHIRVAICINETGFVSNFSLTTTNYIKFPTKNRDFLFENIVYLENMVFLHGIIPKLNKKIEQNILAKLFTNKKELQGFFLKSDNSILYYHNAPQYFIRAHSFVPYFWNEQYGEKISIQNKKINFDTDKYRDAVIAILVSTLFYWWYVLQSDCRHLNLKEINEFPINLNDIDNDIIVQLGDISKLFQSDLQKKSFRKEAIYKATGKVIYDEFYPKLSKPIIDEIDKVLAKHYGFTEEELDFIINYDIKYRMGAELEENE
jgi:hypothetical protein